MRRQTQNMLRRAVLSLQKAHAAVDDKDAEDEVHESVKQLIVQFRKIHRKTSDPYLPFNRAGALTGLYILEKNCSTHFSDWRFIEMYGELSSGILSFAHPVFHHDEAQRQLLENDLDGFYQTLLPLKAASKASERPYSFASVFLSCFPTISTVVS